MSRKTPELCLGDRYGYWCAYCLEYLAPGEIERHHVYPRRFTAETQGLAAQAYLEWVVPVHNWGWGCHRDHIQPVSDAAGLVLRTLGRQVLPAAKLEQVGRSFREQGNINLAIFAHCLAADSEVEPSEARRQRVQALAVAAGSRLGAPLFGSLIRVGTTTQYPRYIRLNDAPSFNYASNLLANLGSFKRAARFADAAKEKAANWPTTHRLDWLASSIARRQLAITMDLQKAQQTVILAHELRDVYGLRTTLIMSGWAKMAAEQYANARDDFEAVFQIPGELVSLWHRMEALRGLGCAVYLCDRRTSESAQLGASHLQTAQYIMGMLGLRGIAVPDVRRSNCSLHHDIMPSDFLSWLIDEKPDVLTRDTLAAQRKETIPMTRDEVLRLLRNAQPAI